MSGLTGSIASQRIAGNARSGVTIDHVWPASVVFQTPPRSAPRYSVLGSVGCGASVITRPDHVLRVMGSLIGCGPIDAQVSPGIARFARPFGKKRRRRTAGPSTPED